MKYAAFWLDSANTDADKRVVICRPFVEKPTTAWAILRSAVREKRTGGILAGAEEKLMACIEAIDHQDGGWPNDPDRMVGQISKLAQTMGCTVVFRQNMAPDGMQQHSSVWSRLGSGGTPEVLQEDMRKSVVRIPLVGSPIDVATAIEVGRQLGWTQTDFMADQVETTICPGVRLTLSRYPFVNSRASLLVEYVHAGTDVKTNAAGRSENVKLHFDRVDELLDTMLGPTAKRYKFVLLIKDRTNSTLFFGTKPAKTLRQAIEQFVDHMGDRTSSDEPRASKPESDDRDVFDEAVTPSLQDCRFWSLV